MLQARSIQIKAHIKSVLDLLTHVEVKDNGVHVCGHITFDQMKQIVECLEIKFKKGHWYRCIKDTMDNTGEVRLFKKGEYYLCPKDNVLVAENNMSMQWHEWHHPEICFVEDYNKNNIK